MKVAPAPAQGLHPQPSPNPPTVSGDAARAGAPPPSSTTANTDVNSNSGGGREGSGRWAAAVLLLTHVVELAAMVAATLMHALPLSSSTKAHIRLQEVSHASVDTQHAADAQHPSTLAHEHRHGLWGSSAVFLQVGVGGAPLLLVTTISLVWAVRAQDFSGRATARLLCWLLHLLQASILWRFLKVHLAFDPSDVAELGTLRFVQVHLHTLPFLVVHVAIVVGGGCGPGIVSVLVAAAMVVSAVVTIIVATTVSPSSRPSSLTPPTITQVAHNPVHGSEYSHDAAARVVVAVTTSCVVWTRAVALAALVCLHLFWAAVLVGVHWLAALVWLSLQKELEPTTLGPLRKALRRVFLAYLLLWDWHVFRDDASAFTVCARPRLPAAYYTITAIQNLAITATWYTTWKGTPPVVRTAIFSSLLAAQAVALLLLALSYLYCSSLLPSWPRDKAGGPISAVSLVTAPTKPTTHATSEAPHHNNSYIDFKDVEDCVVAGPDDHLNESVADSQAEVTPFKNLPPMAHSTPRTPLPLKPRLMATHLPPTIFSFSHDILPPRHSKSERSSTDNGSFNSRNTNTLPAHIPPEYDVLHRTHGSFSDSFSSLSCGTIQRPIAGRSRPPADPSGALTPPPVARVAPPSHFSCRNGFCHCKLFDGIEDHCDVEGQEEEEEAKKEVPSLAGLEKAPVNEEVVQQDVSELPLAIQVTSSATTTNALKGLHEGAREARDPTPRVAMVRGMQRFRVVCAACLHAHDPLLTQCHALAVRMEALSFRTPGRLESSEMMLSPDHLRGPSVLGSVAGVLLSRSCMGLGGASSTDYPSDTEITATADTLSSASVESHSTYTTWPVGRGPGMARLLQLHPGSHDYVTAWLRHQQTRDPRMSPPPPHQAPQESSYSTTPESLSHRYRRPRRRLPRHKDPPPLHLLQDLETVV
ncbi:hypothetical protein E2C01_050922 [Portunus trituberculatus]|uniref:XK-related protein n=1 Tax=Portunus trituberculatus TaxID=210409 RepID=A0A5B7GK93_PORTR|nr:hypothetical protein [Portunus trituberculatus]